MTPKKITWVIAHNPAYLFLRAAEYFRSELEKRVPGQIEIEVLTDSDYAEKYNGGQAVSMQDLLDLMESDRVQVSQLYTTYLATRYSRDLNVIDLPFLFEDHDHASRVFEGGIGQELLDGVERDSDDRVKALAFTYSGGWRQIPSKKVLSSVDDFRGVKFRVSSGPVIKDTFDTLGADTVWFPVEELGERAANGEVEAGESTYTRYYSVNQDKSLPIIVDCEHNIACTSIIINKKFWNTLTAEQQEAMQEAAKASAAIERVESIRDAERVEAECRKNGITVIKWESNELDRFKQVTAPLYEKYENYFSNNLLNRIRRA